MATQVETMEVEIEEHTVPAFSGIVYCQDESCSKQARFGFPGSVPQFCKAHSMEGMENLVFNRKCRDETCHKVPVYGWLGGEMVCCKVHADKGMLDLRERKCILVGCKNRARYGAAGKIPIRCLTHIEEGLVQLRPDPNICGVDGCTNAPTFRANHRRTSRCREHAAPNMLETTRRMSCQEAGCGNRPTHGPPNSNLHSHCQKHALAHMVPITSCEEPGCEDLAVAGYVGAPLTRCQRHALQAMERPRKGACKVVGCNTRASYGPPGVSYVLFCHAHRQPGQVSRWTLPCLEPGCAARASYAAPGTRRPIRCSEHAWEGCVDVTWKQKKCETPECKFKATWGFPQTAASACPRHAVPGMEDASERLCEVATCGKAVGDGAGEAVGARCRWHLRYVEPGKEVRRVGPVKGQEDVPRVALEFPMAREMPGGSEEGPGGEELPAGTLSEDEMMEGAWSEQEGEGGLASEGEIEDDEGGEENDGEGLVEELPHGEEPVAAPPPSTAAEDGATAPDNSAAARSALELLGPKIRPWFYLSGKAGPVPNKCSEHAEPGMEAGLWRKCIVLDCNHLAKYGTPNHSPLHCVAHRGGTETNVANFVCDTPACGERATHGHAREEEGGAEGGVSWEALGWRALGGKSKGPVCLASGCGKAPCKAMPGTQKPTHCSTHALPGMQFAGTKLCRHEGCQKTPAFGLEGKRPTHCAAHRLPDQVNVCKAVCEHPNCHRQRTHGFPGTRTQFCEWHSEPGMRRIRRGEKRTFSARAEGAAKKKPKLLEAPPRPGPSLGGLEEASGAQAPVGPATAAAGAGAVMVVGTHRGKQCRWAGCDKTGVFGFPGQRPSCCKTHAEVGMVDVVRRKCTAEGCSKYPIYGYEERSHCAKHREPAMLLLSRGICTYEGCDERATFESKGQSASRCKTHAEPGMVEKPIMRRKKRVPSWVKVPLGTTTPEPPAAGPPKKKPKAKTTKAKPAKSSSSVPAPVPHPVAIDAPQADEVVKQVSVSRPAQSFPAVAAQTPLPSAAVASEDPEAPRQAGALPEHLANRLCAKVGCKAAPEYSWPGERATHCGMHFKMGMRNMKRQLACLQTPTPVSPAPLETPQLAVAAFQDPPSESGASVPALQQPIAGTAPPQPSPAAPPVPVVQPGSVVGLTHGTAIPIYNSRGARLGTKYAAGPIIKAPKRVKKGASVQGQGMGAGIGLAQVLVKEEEEVGEASVCLAGVSIGGQGPGAIDLLDATFVASGGGGSGS